MPDPQRAGMGIHRIGKIKGYLHVYIFSNLSDLHWYHILYGVAPRKDRIHNAGMGLLYTGMVNGRLHGCRLTSLYDLHWYQDLFKWYLLLKEPDLQRAWISIYAIGILKMRLRVCRLISLYDLHCCHADVILYPPSKNQIHSEQVCVYKPPLG